MPKYATHGACGKGKKKKGWGCSVEQDDRHVKFTSFN